MSSIDAGSSGMSESLTLLVMIEQIVTTEV